MILKAIVSEQELIEHARKYVSDLKNGVPILLFGEIGAGKTTWVRGLLQAAIESDLRVSSPTFSLMIPYSWSEGIIWHMDLYRLEQNNARLEDLGIRDYLHQDICIIEWAEYLGDFCPKECVKLSLMYTKEEGMRILEIKQCYSVM